MERYLFAHQLTGREVAALFARYDVFSYVRKFFGAFHTMDEKLFFVDIDEFIARARQNSPDIRKMPSPGGKFGFRCAGIVAA